MSATIYMLYYYVSMKLLGTFLFWLFIIFAVVNISLIGFSYINKAKLKGAQSIVSPLPSLLVNSFYKEAEAQEYWQPTIRKTESFDNSLKFTAKGVIAYDLSTDRLVYAKNYDERLPIASLTKIMTAIVAMENMDINSEITITNNAASVGENAMGITKGEKITVENLLYGLILNSGNDAAEALAEGSKFGRESFLYLMNKKAEDLGLSQTRFTNPSGLEGDGEQYSTAKELLILTRYAMLNSDFARITETVEKNIPSTSSHKTFYLYNQTNLLTTYPGVKGVKTGFTDEAGMCLVTYLDYKGHKIIAVLLNSQNRRQEMKDLLDYSLKKLGVEPPKHS